MAVRFVPLVDCPLPTRVSMSFCYRSTLAVRNWEKGFWKPLRTRKALAYCRCCLPFHNRDCPRSSLRKLCKKKLGYSRKTLHESTKVFVEQARHIARNSFKPRPNSWLLATAGSVMTIGLSINGCSHSKKTVWRERTRLTSPEVWAAATSKIWRDSGRTCFSPPHLTL